MCLTNDCCDDNFNGRIALTPKDNPTSTVATTLDIDIVGISPIRVVKSMRGATTVYTISLYIPVGPTTSLSANPSTVEFNKPFTSIYTGTYAQGSELLTTKTLTPQTSPVANTDTSPFTFTVTGNATQVGNQYPYTLSVVDAANKTSSSNASINVMYRYYRGLIPRNATLTASAASGFESGLGDSVTSVFGSKRGYTNATGAEAHYCWLRPVGSPEMGLVYADAFEFPTAKEPYTIMLNGAEYEITKSVNFYPTSYSIDLNF